MSHAPKELPPLRRESDEPTSSRERMFLAFGRVDILCVLTLALIVLHLTGVVPTMKSFWQGTAQATGIVTPTTENP